MTNEDIARQIGGLDAKVDTLLDDRDYFRQRLDRIDSRLNILDNFKAKMLGIGTAVSALVALATTVIGNWIKTKLHG